MTQVRHKTGSLFEAPTGSILVHACNSYGVWGSGIAVEFRKRFPKSHKEYRDYCEHHDSKVSGTTFLTSENVGCLITSGGFAKSLDERPAIIGNTILALKDLFKAYLDTDVPIEIHSNRFNSGLFNVPWEHTETALKGVLLDFPKVTWIVWTPPSIPECDLTEPVV
jgi:ADP-ribose 1''-phosphate phosphatase